MKRLLNSERWLPWFAGCALLFALHVCLRRFSGTLWAGGVALSLLVLVSFTVTGCGRLLLRSFRVSGASEPERTLVGATLGLGLLSQGVFLLGVLGWLRTWTVSALLGVFWIIGFTEMRDLARSLGANISLLRDRPTLAGGVAGVLALLFWLTWVPPHYYDSLVYHLPLADAYAREGRIYALPDLLYTHFPQNGEMLYTLALLLGSDVLAKMFTWMGAFLSVWWVVEMGKRHAPVGVVLLACLLTVTHTAVMLHSPSCYVECLVMLWITASVLSFLRWRAEADEPHMPRGWLALAGIFAGLGVGTKYYAGICPALLGTYLLGRWLASRFPPAKTRPAPAVALSRLRDGTVFLAAASATGLPWLLKNAVMVGNPVFPFLYRLFPMHGVDWAGPAAQRYFEILTEYGHAKSGWLKDLFQFPYLALTNPERFGGGADVLGSLGWGLLFACVPLAVWAAWRKRYLRWLGAYCLAHWVLWFSTGVVLRFLIVLVPLLSLLAASGLHQAWSCAGRAGRILLGAAVALLLWTNIMLFLYVNIVLKNFTVPVGAKTRHEFLAEKLDYYPCAAFARERLDENDRILIVGEQRSYYVRQPHSVTSPMSPNRFVRLANDAKDPVDLARRLKDEAGFTHMLYVPREGQRLGEQYGVFHFSERGRENWGALEDGHVEKLFTSPGRCVLYKVL